MSTSNKTRTENIRMMGPTRMRASDGTIVLAVIWWNFDDTQHLEIYSVNRKRPLSRVVVARNEDGLDTSASTDAVVWRSVSMAGQIAKQLSLRHMALPRSLPDYFHLITGVS